MSYYLGDYTEDYATLNLKFTSRTTAGVPSTLGGTPVISVYKANGAVQSTAGITLTADFDSVAGLNNVLIDLSADAFYAIGNDYQVVITAGTVNSVSVVGEVVGEFSIENRFDNDTAKATAIAALNDFDPAADTVANVTLTATTTTNTDMRGTDGANTTAPDNTSIAAILTDTADMQPRVIAIEVDTNELQSDDIPATLAAQDVILADIPTTAEFEARTPSAAELLYIVRHAATALPVTFTGGTTTTAIFGNVDGSAASTTDDVYNSRLLVFNLGTLNVQVCQITDYVGFTKTATISAVTTAVASSHTAVLV